MTAGTYLGRNELLRLIAGGGMGEVYLARQTSSVEGFSTLAAVKVLLKNLSTNQAFVRMFLDEARIVGKLHHKNIVQIRDVTQQDGQYYMVMEYIPGQNLRELLGNAAIRDRPLFEPRLGAEVFADLAGALGAAHAAGLVHRDVSPNNIMISDEGIPKLIDFGVARALGTASLTTPGTLKGKFGYMAPEYVRSEAYDLRVDVFSLGVVMWETFARRRLFRGVSAADQLQKLLESDIPRLDQVLPEFPAELATLVATTLERDPQRRISSAMMLADALSEIAQALPPGPDATLRRWLEHRIPGRLEDRRQTDQILLSLPAGAPIPDFGPAPSLDQNAGSVPGTYGYHANPKERRSGFITDPPPMGNQPSNETSIRTRNSQTLPPPIAAAAPMKSRRAIVIALAGIATLGIALPLLMLDDGTSGGVSTPTAAAPPPSPEIPLAEAHRQIGLKAMADGDYTKARRDFSEALRAGGSGDLIKLIGMASQLETEALIRTNMVTPTIEVSSAAVEKSDPKPATTKIATANVTAKAKAAAAAQEHRSARGAQEPTFESAAEAPRSPPMIVPTTGDVVTSVVPSKVMVVETTPEPAVAPTRAPAPIAARSPSPTPRVNVAGDADAGTRVVGACNGCHAQTGVSAVNPRRYTRFQWDRFFATGQHDRYVPIGDRMTAQQLSAAMASLRTDAADMPENQGAGVRE